MTYKPASELKRGHNIWSINHKEDINTTSIMKLTLSSCYVRTWVSTWPIGPPERYDEVRVFAEAFRENGSLMFDASIDFLSTESKVVGECRSYFTTKEEAQDTLIAALKQDIDRKLSTHC